MTDDEPIPEEALGPLKAFNEAMTAFEDALNEFVGVPFPQQMQRPPLDKARAECSSLLAMNSLYWTYLACEGKNPKDDETLATELSRAKQCMAKLKEFDEHHLRPSVNKRAAGAFVRNALFDPRAPKKGEGAEKEGGKERMEE